MIHGDALCGPKARAASIISYRFGTDLQDVILTCCHILLGSARSISRVTLPSAEYSVSYRESQFLSHHFNMWRTAYPLHLVRPKLLREQSQPPQNAIAIWRKMNSGAQFIRKPRLLEKLCTTNQYLVSHDYF